MWQVEVEGLTEFLRDLRVLSTTGARQQLAAEFRPLAARIATTVRANAHSHVRPAVRAASRGGLPAVIVDGSKAPDNRLWEWGGRHPVYGNLDVWVYQAARPYVGPAVDAHLEDAREATAKALDNALTSAGWS